MIWAKKYFATAHKPKLNNLIHKRTVRGVHFTMYFVLFALMVLGIFMVTNYEHP